MSCAPLFAIALGFVIAISISGEKRERSAYFYAKIGKWIGPNLQKLAFRYGVQYSADDAHGAAYDVDVTAQCLRHMLAAGPLA